MAVFQEYQGTGLGKELISVAESIAKAKKFQEIELHARVSAQGFYEKLGYKIEGNSFTESTVETIKMRKYLED